MILAWASLFKLPRLNNRRNSARHGTQSFSSLIQTNEKSLLRVGPYSEVFLKTSGETGVSWSAG